MRRPRVIRPCRRAGESVGPRQATFEETASAWRGASSARLEVYMAFGKGRKNRRTSKKKKRQAAKEFRMRLRERREAIGPELEREVDRHHRR